MRINNNKQQAKTTLTLQSTIRRKARFLMRMHATTRQQGRQQQQGARIRVVVDAVAMQLHQST
jgi:hypothetical protein